MERNTDFGGNSFPGLSDLTMVLMGALKKGCRKSLEPCPLRLSSRSPKTEVIAILASLIDTVSNIFQKILKEILITVDYFEPHAVRKMLRYSW